jgi:hypothetical protein
MPVLFIERIIKKGGVKPDINPKINRLVTFNVDARTGRV